MRLRHIVLAGLLAGAPFALFPPAGAGSPSPGGRLPREIIGQDGAPMVLIPRGEFIMGSPPGSYIFGDNEQPQRRVWLADFYIDKFEVTNERFGRHFTPAESYMGTFKRPGQPVVGVTWFQARDYCARAGRRLPTEAEWEKAARGTDGRIFPWGNEPATCDYAVMGMELPACFRGYTTWDVGSHPRGASPYGAHDMAGNVMEWVADWYAGAYYRAGPLRDPKGPRGGTLRVLRGGAWFNSGALLRAAFRTGFDPRSANHGVGFRCARSAAVGLVRRPGGVRLTGARP